jgi:hypothetical protein
MRQALRSVSLAIMLAVPGTLSPAATHAYSLTSWSWNEPITLKLVDGRQVEGRYRGVSGRASNPDTYGERYATWRAKHARDAAPALGDTLLVTGASGEPLRGAFRGFADHALLIGTEDSCLYLVLPLKEVTAVRLVGASDEDAKELAAHQRWKSAPSVYAVSLQTDSNAFAVPLTMVASREMLPRPGGNRTMTVAVGVLVVVVLAAGAALAVVASSFSQPMI